MSLIWLCHLNLLMVKEGDVKTEVITVIHQRQNTHMASIRRLVALGERL